MTRQTSLFLGTSLLLLAASAACTGELQMPDGSGGAVGSGGALPGSGGAASGGAVGSGGASSGGAGSGGVVGSGGASSGGSSSGGSTSGSGGGTAIPATFATLKSVIDIAGCDGGDCHDGNEANPLALVDRPELHDHLTSTISTHCENLPVVDPGNPEGSALIKVLKGPCGTAMRMPRGCMVTPYENNCVPDNYIAAIEAWVLSGAPAE